MARRTGDVLGPVKEGPLGETNARLTARLDAAKDALPEGWKTAVRAAEREAEAFDRLVMRKGVCPRCHMVRSSGIARRRHECW